MFSWASPVLPLPTCWSRGLNVAGALPGQDTGWNNQLFLPQLTDAVPLENLRQVQRRNGIEPAQRMEKSASCRLSLTVEMETGTGKTYIYINLNQDNV